MSRSAFIKTAFRKSADINYHPLKPSHGAIAGGLAGAALGAGAAGIGSLLFNKKTKGKKLKLLLAGALAGGIPGAVLGGSSTNALRKTFIDSQDEKQQGQIQGMLPILKLTGGFNNEDNRSLEQRFKDQHNSNVNVADNLKAPVIGAVKAIYNKQSPQQFLEENNPNLKEQALRDLLHNAGAKHSLREHTIQSQLSKPQQ